MAKQIVHLKKDRAGRRADETIGLAMERIESLSRRQMLKRGLAGAAAIALAPLAGLISPRQAAADDAVKTGKFVIPRLEFSVSDETGNIWATGPIGDANLRQKLRELTNINASEEAKVVRLADLDDMSRYPYVFMTSEGHFKLPDNEEKNLREFLERGGFVHADDCVFPSAKGKSITPDPADSVFKPRQPGDPLDIDRFFRDYVILMKRLFPDNPMRKIPNDHELFHLYFDFKDGCPHMQGVKHGAYGLFEPGTGRIMTIATPGDLHCGWMNQYWSKETNLEAIKMGINIIIYFLSH